MRENPENRLGTSPRNVGKILNMQKPTTKKDLRGLIGLVNFYGKSYRRAEILEPLTRLTGKKYSVQQDWGSEQDKSLSEIKRIMSSEPVLKLADLNEPFVIQCDASNTGIGGVLMQKEGGKNHPVMYASRKLLPREQRYSTGEKECLAVMFTVEKFQRYLKGQEFIIETDHRPLQILNGVNAINPRIMRWGLILQGYKYRMDYIPGKDNVVADYLSRQCQECETGL